MEMEPKSSPKKQSSPTGLYNECCCKSENDSLLKAAERGHVECVKAVLTAGADVNSEHSNGKTPIIFAAEKGRVECVKAIVKAGADVNSQNNFGDTALTSAAVNGHVECVDLVIPVGADVNTKGTLDRTDLIWAAIGGHDESLGVMIQAGANVSMQDQPGCTGLIGAAEYQHDKCVELPISAGADVNKQINTGHTALIQAAIYAHSAHSISLLLSSGGKINVTASDSYNANNIRFNALELCLRYSDVQENIMLLYAAGDTIGGTKVRVPDYLKELIKGRQGLNLQHQCRQTIRKHLIELDPHKNLFNRVPRLGLPSQLQKYLLYYVSLDYDN